MKKAVFIILPLVLSSVTLFAQREIRKKTHAGDNKYSAQSYGAAEEMYKKAIEAYAKSVESDKKHEIKDQDRNKEAFYNLGNTYYRQGNWDDAVKEYENYIKMDPNAEQQSWAWSNSGNAYIHKAIEPKPQQEREQQQTQQQENLPRIEDLEKAIDAYKNTLRRSPDDNEARYNLAVAQKLLKDQKDNQDQNKDQDKDNKQDKDKKDQDKQDKQDKQDQKHEDQNKKDQEQNKNGMSQQNMEQMLNAMQQQEKETQAKVQQIKAQQEKKKNAENRKQDKDW